MKVEIDLPHIEGYYYTGEFRVPKEGERYLNYEKALSLAFGENEISYPLLERAKETKWTPTDGEMIWVAISDGSAISTTYYDFLDPVGRFETEEEALEAAKQWQEMLGENNE